MRADPEPPGASPGGQANPSPLRGEALRTAALARKLGLAFRDGGMVPAPDVPFQQAIAAGIAALDEQACGFRIALSPTRQSEALLASQDLRDRPDVVMMPPGRFRQMLRHQSRQTIRDHIAHHLGRQHPGQSARHGLNLRQACVCAMLLAAAALGIGAQPAIGLTLLAVAATSIFLALVTLRLGALIDAWPIAPEPQRRMLDADLPVYSILVPLYREAGMLDQLIGALLDLDYPAARLDIKILIEEGDIETRLALGRRDLPAHVDVLVVPAGRPQTKPRALNMGLLEARGALLAIYDAEDRPDPGQLRLSACMFSRLPKRVACLQGRLVIDNADDGILTRMFALEYAALFDVINAGLMHMGLPVLLGGTSNHFRTDALRAVGGWDAWNVTEDADLAFRFVRAGYAIADLPSPTLEEAPASLRLWLRQRVRWKKGFLQTLITHTRTPLAFVREAGAAPALTLLCLCGGTLLSALAYPFVLGALLVVLLVHGLPQPVDLIGAIMTGVSWALLVGGVISIAAPIMLGAWKRRLLDLLVWLPAVPFYMLLVSCAAWLALLEYLWAPSRWNKTDHGLARSSRQVARPERPQERTA